MTLSTLQEIVRNRRENLDYRIQMSREARIRLDEARDSVQRCEEREREAYNELKNAQAEADAADINS